MAAKPCFIPLWSHVTLAFGIQPNATKPSPKTLATLDLLSFALRKLIERSDFDNANYLARNPDVTTAIATGAVKDGLDHFIRFGFVEGRAGGIVRVDQAYYLQANPDVAAAIGAWAFKSAADHYHQVGAREWRAPNQDLAEDVAAWQRVLHGVATKI